MIDLVLECNPDEALMKALGYTRKMITHQPNKGQVINYLEKNPAAIGIVDEDPGSANPTYFALFKKDIETKFNLDRLSISSKGTRLIVIRPRLEEWIIKCAAESKIDIQKHSLPTTGHQLHKIINTRLPQFQMLLKEMTDAKSSALLHLKKLIDNK